MKALFQRFRKEKDKDQPKDPDSLREKLPQLPPLPGWPPQRASAVPSSIQSFKPLPEISSRPLPLIDTALHPSRSSDFSSNLSQTSTPRPPLVDIPASLANELDRSPTPKADLDNSSGRNSRKTASGSTSSNSTTHDVQKKVAFISPPLSSANDEQRAPWSDAPSSTSPPPGPPLKTTLSRFQATHGKEPRGHPATTPTTTNPSPSKPEFAPNTMKATSTRTLVSPPPQKFNIDAVSITHTLRSITPYSHTSVTNSSQILAAASWSEGAEEDLVSNLGSRERTRQEVLFEILASEERYVQELIKMRDTFVEPLLHPFAGPSTPIEYDHYSRMESSVESNDNLPPIAARFMSPSPFQAETPTTPTRRHDKDYAESINTDDEDEIDDQIGRGYPDKSGRASQTSKHNHPRSPYRATQTRSPATTVPFPTRSQTSIPPPARNHMSISTHSLGRQSGYQDPSRERKPSQGQASTKTSQTQGRGPTRKLKKSQTKNDSIFGNALSLHQIPEDLRLCLEVIDNGVLEGHKRLSEALRKRYEEQVPLVRSLADVFVANSDIFHGYAQYVLHLERALEQVDEALSDSGKKPKNKDAIEWAKVCKYLRLLEESAAEKGETGLAITLSKPFQRLLKYPLLFQNLLFHTDPSTFEYESTLQMVAEVEAIVRSIEDEKIQKEERDKTRDVFARIEGLEKVKQLALPKPSRILIEERPYIGSSGFSNPPQDGSPRPPGSPPPVAKPKGKSSFKRLSDVLNTGTGMGGKKDLWLVVFNDVVLQCQRTGTTSLPLVAVTNSRTNSLPELQGKAKYATTGRRNSHNTKPRNLYKFLKFETWSIGDVVQPREGVVSMDDVARTKSRVYTSYQPRIVPLPDDDEDGGVESDDSDRKSKMSFSYWGADKITVQKPNIKPRFGPNGVPRRPGVGAAYARESSANAKFGSRLVSGDGPNSPRSTSRRAQTAASRRPPLSDDTHSMKVTVTRPAWDTSTRSQVAATPIPKRTRNTSQGSGTVATRVPTSKGLSSPVPSEDSGVGFYRQIMQDPTLSQE